MKKSIFLNIIMMALVSNLLFAADVVTQGTTTNQLMQGIHNSYETIARRLWAIRTYVSGTNRYGRITLEEASRWGSADIVQYLLLTNTGNRELALIEAASNGHEDIVQQLLASRPYINYSNVRNDNALISATRQRHTKIVKLLLDAGADTNRKAYLYRDTPLIIATLNEDENILQLLLAAEADINAINFMGQTALMWAAIKGYETIAQLLLAAGADVKVLNKQGESALMLAEKGDHSDVAILIQQASIRYVKAARAHQENCIVTPQLHHQPYQMIIQSA